MFGVVSGTLAHKYYRIEKILSFYPNLPFILIGDSGQEDPYIYRQLVKDFPGVAWNFKVDTVAEQLSFSTGFIISTSNNKIYENFCIQPKSH
ncbi:MAG: App1 family protein [Cytophagaceae bacterium]|nr:App1 family protein [Cytophagaceae bacterium]